jgi:hypothetical protein
LISVKEAYEPIMPLLASGRYAVIPSSSSDANSKNKEEETVQKREKTKEIEIQSRDSKEMEMSNMIILPNRNLKRQREELVPPTRQPPPSPSVKTINQEKACSQKEGLEDGELSD